MVTRAPAGMPGQFSFDAFLNRRRAKKYQAVFASLAVGALAATWMQCCPDCERYLDRACRGSVASMRLNANGGCRSRSGSLYTNPDFDRLRCLPRCSVAWPKRHQPGREIFRRALSPGAKACESINGILTLSAIHQSGFTQI